MNKPGAEARELEIKKIRDVRARKGYLDRGKGAKSGEIVRYVGGGGHGKY